MERHYYSFKKHDTDDLNRVFYYVQTSEGDLDMYRTRCNVSTVIWCVECTAMSKSETLLLLTYGHLLEKINEPTYYTY